MGGIIVKEMKKFLSGLFLGAIVFTSIGVFAVSYVAEPATFKIMVNGKEFVSDKPALVVEGSTYLPLRAIGEALGVPVTWNAELMQAEVGTVTQNLKSGYSRKNPAPLNVAQNYVKTSEIFDEYNYTVSVKVMEIVRGESAYAALNAKGSAYPEPDEGYEYLNAKIAFSVIQTKDDFSVEPSQSQFTSFTSNNEECPDNMWASIKPRLEGALYEGGNTEGWITVMVKKDDPAPKLAYGLDYNGANGIWFALYK